MGTSGSGNHGLANDRALTNEQVFSASSRWPAVDAETEPALATRSGCCCLLPAGWCLLAARLFAGCLMFVRGCVSSRNCVTDFSDERERSFDAIHASSIVGCDKK